MKPEILAVDDQLAMRRLLKVTLMDEFNVDLAEDGVDAYGKITGRRDPYDLIITDLNMPNLDGIGLISKTRKLSRYMGIPILIVSTESQIDRKTDAKKAGANGWIVKPFEKAQLLNAANKMTGRLDT